MSGGCTGLLLDWACQRTCACERWGRETPQRTAPGEALVSRQWTRVQFPPPPPPCSHHVSVPRRARSWTGPFVVPSGQVSHPVVAVLAETEALVVRVDHAGRRDDLPEALAAEQPAAAVDELAGGEVAESRGHVV